MRIPYDELFDGLLGVLLKLNFEQQRARLCARLFADASRDGVYSHGLNRFPQFLRMVRNGIIAVDAEPEPDRIDFVTHYAIALSREHGIGCVALANTNHWMRGGSYGWQAAEARAIGICWTNTIANLPPWGASDPRVGNNPLIIAVPRAKGHVVLDMAMSQFSYGALATYRMRGEPLPVEGGFDAGGRLTRDPAAIEASKRPLPIGYWKGSGLALMLDMVGALLSGGCATHQIPADTERETNLSQVFIAVDPSSVDRAGTSVSVADEIVKHLQPPAARGQVRYPGERVLQTRKENIANGIPVEPAIWREVQGLN